MVKLYKNFYINKSHKESIILIGNFDGVHKNEIQNDGIETISKQYETIVNFIQSDLKW